MNCDFSDIIKDLDNFKDVLSKKESIIFNKKLYIGIESYDLLEREYIIHRTGLEPDYFRMRLLRASSFFS